VSALDAVLAGPWGAALVVGAMALVTYACRIGGVVLMSRVRITPLVERALAALPGSIVAATVVPLALRSGPSSIAGIAAAVLVTLVVRNEFAALAAGMALAAALRLAGMP
jgi:uncharacterized membrane protein